MEFEAPQHEHEARARYRCLNCHARWIQRSTMYAECPKCGHHLLVWENHPNNVGLREMEEKS